MDTLYHTVGLHSFVNDRTSSLNEWNNSRFLKVPTYTDQTKCTQKRGQ